MAAGAHLESDLYTKDISIRPAFIPYGSTFCLRFVLRATVTEMNVNIEKPYWIRLLHLRCVRCLSSYPLGPNFASFGLRVTENIVKSKVDAGGHLGYRRTFKNNRLPNQSTINVHINFQDDRSECSVASSGNEKSFNCKKQ